MSCACTGVYSTHLVHPLGEADRRYRERGLTIVGIHTPEFPPYAGEHDKGNLARALDRQGITYPNAQDNDRRTWDAYSIRYWPSFVLIDKAGTITDAVRVPGEIGRAHV